MTWPPASRQTAFSGAGCSAGGSTTDPAAACPAASTIMEPATAITIQVTPATTITVPFRSTSSRSRRYAATGAGDTGSALVQSRARPGWRARSGAGAEVLEHGEHAAVVVGRGRQVE